MEDPEVVFVQKKKNTIEIPWWAIVVAVALIGGYLYLKPASNREMVPQQAQVASDQSSLAQAASALEAYNKLVEQGGATQDQAAQVDPEVIRKLLEAYNATNNAGDTDADPETGGGAEEPAPASQTIRVTYVAPNGEITTESIKDRGVAALAMGTTAIQIAAMGEFEGYGISQTGPTNWDAADSIAGTGIAGLVIKKFLPNRPIDALQQNATVTLRAWLAAAFNIPDMLETYSVKQFYIPPGFTETEEYKGGKRFYNPAEAESWAQAIVAQSGVPIGGALQGSLGAEIKATVQLCHFPILDHEGSQNGRIGKDPSDLGKDVMTLLTVIRQFGSGKELYKEGSALSEAETIAWSVLTSDENYSLVYTLGEESWAPGGASYESEVTRVKLLGYNEVDLKITVIRTGEECTRTIFPGSAVVIPEGK